MGSAVDRLGAWVLDAGASSAAWLSLVMLAIMACRQPIFRRDLARAGVSGALLILPMTLLPIGRLDAVGLLTGAFGTAGDAAGGVLIGDRLARTLTIAYLGIVSAGVGWTLLGGWATHRLIRESADASAEAKALYDALPFQGRARRRPGLCVSRRIGWPALTGVIRPTIVIPDDWDRPGAVSTDRLRLGLIHELSHAERADPTFHWLGRLAQAVWIALPMMWWLRRQLGDDQEVLADEKTARSLDASRPSYATSLVALAAGEPIGKASGPRPATQAINPDGSPLVRRVAMLVRCPFPIEAAAPLWWRLGLPPLAIAAALLSSRVTVDGGRSGTEPIAVVEPSSAFHLRELSIPAVATPTPIRLPAPLPRRFELSAMLRAVPARLGEIAVAGYRPATADGDAKIGVGTRATWHQVRLVVDGPEARFWIDDRPSPAVNEPESPEDWLTLCPATGEAMEVRDLILTPVPGEDATASPMIPAGRRRHDRR